MKKEVQTSIKQEQIHDILFNREIGWQDIIYDLINTEQLDPWDVNITILTERYLIKIQKLEEADFFVSSKVLLAASLLLRIKSEILLNKYIKSIDEILFGSSDQKYKPLERIDLDEEIPELVPRSPMPRAKKVTLKELMEALGKAITTENRRIKKEIINRNAVRESGLSLPKKSKLSLKDKVKGLFSKLTHIFNSSKEDKKIHYDLFLEHDKKARVESLVPLLHLEHQKKVWLHQNNHFEDIHIWDKSDFVKKHGHPHKDLMEQKED